MSKFPDELLDIFESLIRLEEDYLVNENTEILDELKSKRSEFMKLQNAIWSDGINKLDPPEVYKTWFQAMFDCLVRAVENLRCPSLRDSRSVWDDEFIQEMFDSSRSCARDAFLQLRWQMIYEIDSSRKTLRSDIINGREFPPTEFLREHLRAFGPIDQDLKATTNRLLPYYPMPLDLPEAIQENSAKEPPTEHDWSILFFALADQAAMSWEERPTRFDAGHEFESSFHSEPFFDKLWEAFGSASVVTPGFTGPSLPDEHEKLDNQAILEIRSWAVSQIAKSGDSLNDVAENDVVPRADMIQTTGENPVPTNSIPSSDFRLQARPRSRDLFDYLQRQPNMEAEIAKVDCFFSGPDGRSNDAMRKDIDRIREDIAMYANDSGWTVEKLKGSKLKKSTVRLVQKRTKNGPETD